MANLTWADHPLLRDRRLAGLVPAKRAIFRGPLVRVSKPKVPAAVVMGLIPEGQDKSLPAPVVQSYGKGRVIYLAAAVDAAMWSYAYPYQRRLLARGIAWAAAKPAPVSVKAPMCVQATYFQQTDKHSRRLIVHLFNGMNTTANHGKPGLDVPLREEVVPNHGIEVRFADKAPKSFHLDPGNRPVHSRRDGYATVVTNSAPGDPRDAGGGELAGYCLANERSAE